MPPQHPDALWTQFLHAWPPERVRKMTLDEYTDDKKQDAFIYWLEKHLDSLGGIWGGSAFKFGIYRRDDTETKPPTGGRIWGKKYAWLKKFGATPEAAFKTIHERLVQVLDAAAAGNFQAIDKIDLARMLKWKVAFLYQDRGHPVVLPIYKEEALSFLFHKLDPKAGKASHAAMYARLSAEHGGKGDVFKVGETLWAEWKQGGGADAGAAPPATTASATPLAATAAPALNLILHGPPGTGKTYHTIDRALAILDPTYLAEHENDRPALKKRYDELAAAGRIKFVTFHQSFAYEDFVEGIRAETDRQSGTLRYKLEDGVFKTLCQPAGATPESVVPAAVGLPDGARVWKISIDRTAPSKTRDYCLSHGEARIGWGHVGDIRSANLQAKRFALGTNDRSSLKQFGKEVKPGDVLLCIRSETEFQAVGIVTAGYRFDENPPAEIDPDMKHVLGVDWRYRGLATPIADLQQQKFTLKTVYPLYGVKVPALEAVLAAKSGTDGGDSGESTAKSPDLPHVLIIDEINRGNISRIFGELITLIEPSKRRGAAEALTVTLPYSKRAFSVPQNLYLIGTMNTADRSLTALDNALRRRFKFEEMPPKPELLDGVTVDGVNIGEMLRVMNQRIEVLFDRDHCLGHTYLLPLKEAANQTLESLESIFRHEILPLLQEYFFEDWEKIAWVLNDHRKKSEKHKFVRKPEKDTAKLFGDAVKQVVDRRWTVQTDAFKQIESYRYIIDASPSIPDPATAAPTPAGTP